VHDAQGKWIGYGAGDADEPPDTGPQVSKIQHRLLYAYPKNSRSIDEGVVENGVYDAATARAVTNIQTFMNQEPMSAGLRTDGVADYATQLAIGAVQPAPAPPTVKQFYQQGVGYPADGFLQPDPNTSYVESRAAGIAEGLRLSLPDRRPKVLIGYSQGEDVDNNWMQQWPADRRDEIKLYIGFGSPCRPPGPTLLGNDPGGAGISGNYTPEWLRDRAYHFTQPGDMYANAVGLLPMLYDVLTHLDLSLEFAMYLFNFAMTAPAKLLMGTEPSSQAGAGALSGLAPLIGLAGNVVGGGLGSAVGGPLGGVVGGMGGNVLGGMLGTVGGGLGLPQQQAGLLNVTQIFAILPQIVQTIVAALQFMFTQAHSHYHDTPQPYWRGMTAVDCAAQIIKEQVHEPETVVVYTVAGTWGSWNEGPPAFTAWKLP
jgi:peptidoglycan hydrolase-like protein with peptidoglycan-binding domain